MSVQPKYVTELGYAFVMQSQMNEHRFHFRTTDRASFNLDAIDDG